MYAHRLTGVTQAKPTGHYEYSYAIKRSYVWDVGYYALQTKSKI